LQHALALLAVPLLFSGELRQLLLKRGRARSACMTDDYSYPGLLHTICPGVMRQSRQHRDR
jgi:hypothetical protein